MMKLTNDTRTALVAEARAAARTDAEIKAKLGTNERRFYMIALNVWDAFGRPFGSAEQGKSIEAAFGEIMAEGREGIVNDLPEKLADEYFGEDGHTRKSRTALAAAGELPAAVQFAHDETESFYTNTSRTNQVLRAMLAGPEARPEFHAYLAQWEGDKRRPSGTLYNLAKSEGKPAPVAAEQAPENVPAEGGEGAEDNGAPEQAPEVPTVDGLLARLAEVRELAGKLSPEDFAKFAEGAAALMKF